jgi:hypothetical protein
LSGETTITVIGNLTNDPELRFTPVPRGFAKADGFNSGNSGAKQSQATRTPAGNELAQPAEGAFSENDPWFTPKGEARNPA